VCLSANCTAVLWLCTVAGDTGRPVEDITGVRGVIVLRLQATKFARRSIVQPSMANIFVTFVDDSDDPDLDRNPALRRFLSLSSDGELMPSDVRV
jgi:hypothetical protein